MSICVFCKKDFSFKSHLDRHISSKKGCKMALNDDDKAILTTYKKMTFETKRENIKLKKENEKLKLEIQALLTSGKRPYNKNVLSECLYCKQNIVKKNMARHLRSCPIVPPKIKKQLIDSNTNNILIGELKKIGDYTYQLDKVKSEETYNLIIEALKEYIYTTDYKIWVSKLIDNILKNFDNIFFYNQRSDSMYYFIHKEELLFKKEDFDIKDLIKDILLSLRYVFNHYKINESHDWKRINNKIESIEDYYDDNDGFLYMAKEDRNFLKISDFNNILVKNEKYLFSCIEYKHYNDIIRARIKNKDSIIKDKFKKYNKILKTKF